MPTPAPKLPEYIQPDDSGVGEVIDSILASDRQPVEKLGRKHLELFRLLAANPTMTQREAAKALGYTEGWVSQVVNTDMFQSLLRDHRNTVVAVAGATVAEKTQVVVSMALSQVEQKLSQDELDPSFALGVARDLGKQLVDRVRSTGMDSMIPVMGVGAAVLQEANEILTRVKAKTPSSSEGRPKAGSVIDAYAERVTE